jgi:lipopolysaccharide export system protein LptA
LLGHVKIDEEKFNLTCKKMKILAKDITSKQAMKNAAENQEDIDDAPKHIGIGDTKEITKIICLEDVIMSRKHMNELQKASGDKGVYMINEQTITLTKKDGKPTLQRGITVMEGSKVILDTSTGQLDVENGHLKNLDGSSLLKD